MQAALQQNLNKYLELHKKRRQWLIVLVVLATITATIVYSLMFLPALSMVRAEFSLETESSKAAFSSAIPVRVVAAADSNAKDDVIFYISAKSTGGALTPEYIFDEDGVCRIKALNDEIVELHRDWSKDGSSNDRDYWFSLEPGKSLSFTLNFVSDSSLYDKSEWLDANSVDINIEQAEKEDTQKNKADIEVFDEKSAEDIAEESAADDIDAKVKSAKNLVIESKDEKDKKSKDRPELLPLKVQEDGKAQTLELKAIAANSIEKAKSLLENEKKNKDNIKDLSLVWMNAEDLPKSGNPVLTATTKSGIKVSLTGPASAFPADTYFLDLEVEDIKLKSNSKNGINQNILDKTEKELSEMGIEPLESVVFDVYISQDGKKVELLEPVTLNIEGFDNSNDDNLTLLYEYEDNELKEVRTKKQKDGSLNMETGSPSTYAVVFASGGFGSIPTGAYEWLKCSSANPFGEASRFNLFSFGDVENVSNIAGSVAVGGNLKGIHYLADTSKNPAALVFNGSMVNDNIQTQVKHANNIWINPSLQTQYRNKLGFRIWDQSYTEEIAEFEDIDAYFASTEACLKAQNERISAMQANGTVQKSGSTGTMTLTFTGTDQSLNIFSVNAADLSSYNDKWVLSVPSGSNIIINVTGGADIEIKPIFTLTDEDGFASRLVWNFAPNIKTIKFAHHSWFLGSIMAPHASIDATGIQTGIKGTVVTASIKASSGFSLFNVVPKVQLPLPKKTVEVNILWALRDITEGEHITLKLKKDNAVIDSVDVLIQNNIKHTWSGLDNANYEIGIDSKQSEFAFEIEENISSEELQKFQVMASPLSNGVLTGDMTVEVKKIWEGGTPGATNTVFHLLANGRFMVPDRTITLSASNNWKGEFADLPEVDENDEPISYSVYESPIAGWSPSVDVITVPRETQGWKNVTGITNQNVINGKIYRFVYGNYALSFNSNNGTLTRKNNNVNDTTQQWRAVITGGSLYFQSVSNTTQYMNISTSGARSNTSRTAITLSNTGTLYGGNRYITLTGTNAGVNSSANSATRFTVYAYDENEVLPKNEFTVTNNKVINPEANIAFPHFKQIDAFRDGVSNPHTNLSGDDFYRLYLDARTKGHPMDIVIVVDRSGSMQYSTTTNAAPTGSQIRRDQAVRDMLNGTGSEDGFIKRFLSLNEQNNLSIVWFGGDWYGNGAFSGTGNNNRAYSQVVDSGIVQGWTKNTNHKVTVNSAPTAQNNNTSNNITYRNANGTNYMAGLWEAADMLRSDPIIQNNGHKKMVMFLTDGAPTYYVNYSSSNSSTNVTYNHYNSWKLNNSNPALYRTGTGTATNQTEIDKSQAAFEDFKLHNPDVIFSSVMFAPASESTTALSVFHNNGGSMRHTQGDNSLPEVFAALIAELTFSQNFSITDNLSKYVDWYSPQPDLKIIRTNLLTGAQDTIWQSTGPASVGVIGSGTAANNVMQDGEQMSIIESVTFNPSVGGNSSGMLQILFDQDYKVDISNKYIVSFNVKVSDYAYQEYAQNKQNGDETGYNGMAGDNNTDYAYNETSSLKPGFFANSGAILKYRYDGQFYEEPYDHPVVQVSSTGIVIKKTDMSGTDLLAGARFDLYKSANQGESGAVLVPGLTGQYGIKINTAALTTGETGTIYVPSLGSATYHLVETYAPTGYQKLDETISFTLEGGSINILNSTSMAEEDGQTPDGVPIILVKNTDGYTLPATGGIGNEIPFAFAIILMAFSSVLLILKKRQKKGASL